MLKYVIFFLLLVFVRQAYTFIYFEFNCTKEMIEKFEKFSDKMHWKVVAEGFQNFHQTINQL